MHKQIIEDLNWRYATKKYDPSKKITEIDLETLLEVLRLTPSSYGLQPLKFLIVENSEIREELRKLSFNQSPITDASHLLVFCAYTFVGDQLIDNHITNTANTRELDPSQLEGYANFMKRTLSSREKTELRSWAEHQAYIALGQLLHACAQLRIDSTPIEGFDKSGYNEFLGLNERELSAVLVCPIGYRSEEDSYQNMRKVRKSSEELFEVI